MRLRRLWASVAAAVMVAAGMSMAVAPPAAAAVITFGEGTCVAAPPVGVSGTWVPNAPPLVGGTCTTTVAVGNFAGNIWVVPTGVTVRLNGPLTTNLGGIVVQDGGRLSIAVLSNSGSANQGGIDVESGGQLRLFEGSNALDAFGISLEPGSSLMLPNPSMTFINYGIIRYCGAELLYGYGDVVSYGILAGNQPVEVCLDSDFDGVPDHLDACPGGDDAADADNDGIPDACDTPEPVKCAAGFYSATGNTPCTAAPAGSYVDAVGATSATLCPVGTFSSTAGSTSCTVAPAGTFVDTTGAIAATSCAAGSYQPNSGAVSCVLAPPGSYTDQAGAQQAQLCPVGKYQPQAGQTSCLLADPGFFVDTTGATAQAPCPAGTTSAAGASSCTATGVVFVGFAQPVDNGALNKAKAGRTIPLKWRVVDSAGAPVTTLTSVQVKAAALSCAVGSTTDTVEEYAAGMSGLQNLGDGYYQWNWATPSSYAKSCKTVTVTLDGGVSRSADFQFTK
jgi:hypothetical protein